MAKKSSTRPQAVPKNNPGGSKVQINGSVPKMQNPPPPPVKKK